MKQILYYLGTTLVCLVGCALAALVVLVVLWLLAIGIAVLAALLALFLLFVAALAPIVSVPVLVKKDRLRAFIRSHSNN